MLTLCLRCVRPPLSFQRQRASMNHLESIPHGQAAAHTHVRPAGTHTHTRWRTALRTCGATGWQGAGRTCSAAHARSEQGCRPAPQRPRAPCQSTRASCPGCGTHAGSAWRRTVSKSTQGASSWRRTAKGSALTPPCSAVVWSVVVSTQREQSLSPRSATLSVPARTSRQLRSSSRMLRLSNAQQDAGGQGLTCPHQRQEIHARRC